MNQNEIEDILYILEELLSDSTIPRNVKSTLTNIQKVMVDKTDDVVVLSRAVYELQDVSNDVNLPLNAKSDIWLLQSKIEKMKEDIK